MLPSVISNYEILEKLGEGGMGVVYKARDTKLDRFVALKFLPPHLGSSDADKTRFTQEAKAAAALNHPNVCSIIDIQEHDGQMFIVMELVDGQTLTDRKNSLTPAQAVGIGVQIADGLAAAHEKGIVHRDVKPDNIMIRRDGIVQIMDFGVAKLRGVSRLTREGSTVGTAGYMSPEQIQGQDADHRSDIFSLGVVLYEMFTGELPFKGVHETALSYEIVNVDPPPMSSVRPGIDPQLDSIVGECLEKDPNERTQSARQVSVDLSRFKRQSGRTRTVRTAAPGPEAGGDREPARTGVPAASSGKRFVRDGIVALIVLCAAFGIWKTWILGESSVRDVIRFEHVLPPDLLVTPTIDVSPDGKQFAYIGTDVFRQQVYVRTLASLEPRPVPGTEGDRPVSGTEGAEAPFYSKDGQWLGFLSGGQMKKISLRGGSAIPICAVSFFRGACWGDDNYIVYAPSPTSGLWRVNAGGGTPEQVTFVDSAAGEINHRYPDVLPGSKAVLFTVKSNSISRFSDAKIAVQRLGSREKKILIEGGSFPHYIPTGHILFGRGRALYAVGFDPDRLEIRGSPVEVLEGGRFVESWGTMSMCVSPSGTLIYAPGGPVVGDSNYVVLYDRKGHGEPLIDAPDSYGSIALSPDRNRIATYMNAANDDVWVYDIRRRLGTRFTFGGGNNWYPLWTPDGRHIIYTAERGGPANLFWRSVDGSAPEQRLAASGEAQYPTACSLDGRFVAFHQMNSAGNADIWTVQLDGDRTPRAFLHSRFDESFAAFSPDGRWLCYQSNESGQFEIYAVPFPRGDGKWQISTGGGISPSWVKGGREIIYYRPSTKSFMRVPIAYAPDVHPGESEELFRIRSEPVYLPNVSADGEHIAVVLPGPQSHLKNLVVVVNWFEELKKQLRSP